MPRCTVAVRHLHHTRGLLVDGISGALVWSLRFGASLELGAWSLELHAASLELGAWSLELFHPLANASDCFTNSSPLHSPSARTIFFAAASSAAALSFAFRSVCIRTSSACVVK